MRLLFLFGPVASGKLTVGRELARLTGWPLFHNHLVVDAVSAVFPFGSPAFVRLREQFWLATFDQAARDDRSLIFTFAPEATVAADFPLRVCQTVEAGGGEVCFVRLRLAVEEQARRLVRPDRAAHGKLRDLALLHQLRPSMDECEQRMPAAALTLDTAIHTPEQAARCIVERFGPPAN